MVAIAMLLSPAERRRRLEVAVERLGSKANLGRRLGYKDGAFVGQMIRADRPITEKTLVALSAIREVSDLFSFSTMTGFTTAGNDERAHESAPLDTTATLTGAQATASAGNVGVLTGPPAPALPDALPVVLDALARAPQREKLRAALLALLEDDAPAYRQRLAELLAGKRRDAA